MSSFFGRPLTLLDGPEQILTFPAGLDDSRLKGREFVAVKHPRVEIDNMRVEDVYSELATELQVLRHAPFQKHENIIDLLGVIYHDAGDIDAPNILPALLLGRGYKGLPLE